MRLKKESTWEVKDVKRKERLRREKYIALEKAKMIILYLSAFVNVKSQSHRA